MISFTYHGKLDISLSAKVWKNPFFLEYNKMHDINIINNTC